MCLSSNRSNSNSSSSSGGLCLSSGGGAAGAARGPAAQCIGSVPEQQQPWRRRGGEGGGSAVHKECALSTSSSGGSMAVERKWCQCSAQQMCLATGMAAGPGEKEMSAAAAAGVAGVSSNCGSDAVGVLVGSLQQQQGAGRISYVCGCSSGLISYACSGLCLGWVPHATAAAAVDAAGQHYRCCIAHQLACSI